MTIDPPTSQANAQPWTVRVAAWSARHRWPVFALWFVATLGIFAFSELTGGIRTTDVNEDPNEQRLESQQAYDVYGASNQPEAPSERVVFVIDGGAGAATDPAFQVAVGKFASDLAGAHTVVDGADTKTFDSLVDAFHAPAQARLISPDGTTVQIVGQVLGERARVLTLLEPIPAIVGAARADMPDATIHVVSPSFINRDIQAEIGRSLDDSLRVTIPATFAILLVAFGAIVAAAIPLMLALTSLAAAFGLIGLYSQLVGPVSPQSTQLIVLIGLAVAVDYSLFMVTRFRSERRRRRSVLESIETSSSTAWMKLFRQAK